VKETALAGEEPLRVLVVHGSDTDRTALTRVLGTDPALKVVGAVADWSHGVRMAARLKPDVILMDFDDAGHGLEANHRIMQEMPTPIVMVVAGPAHVQRERLAEALGSGAIALVQTPIANGFSVEGRRELLNTVKNMASVKVVRRWSKQRSSAWRARDDRSGARSERRAPQLVAVGASTGGPPALRDLLATLPATFPVPVVVVQHMAAGFVGGLVQWLGPQCRLPVQLAQPGARLDRPEVHVAPTGQHLVVRRGTLCLSDGPPVSGQRPSATVLFESVAEAYGAQSVGVLLTGMGEDGATGLRAMKRAGAITVAQDEASSVVFGMPGAALRLEAASYFLPPPAIAALLLELVGRGPED
jgi:two-component system, chemotaxis family, protein-glutamate methylesterase/glutaminase